MVQLKYSVRVVGEGIRWFVELFCVRRNRVLCGFDCIGAFLSFFPLVITTNLA